MLDSYIFVHKDRLDEIDGCGMKLSQWADRQVFINGEERNYISSLLNPRDNIDKYKSREYKVVRLNVDINYCFVAEGFILKEGFNSPGSLTLYTRSIIPAKEYILGMYRQPECLVAKTILSQEMTIPSKALSFPTFYESSETLYLSKLMENLSEENPQFNDMALYYYFNNLAEKGEIDKVTDENAGFVVFSFKDGRKPVVLKLFKQEALLEG